MPFVADPKNYKRVFDPESGWEITHPLGQAEASDLAIAALPIKQPHHGGTRYEFSRNGQFYSYFVGAHARLPGRNTVVVFDQNELHVQWARLEKVKRTIAPEIDNFEGLIDFLKAGVEALETLPRPYVGTKIQIIVCG